MIVVPREKPMVPRIDLRLELRVGFRVTHITHLNRVLAVGDDVKVRFVGRYVRQSQTAREYRQ